MSVCPCGSGAQFEDCCGPLINGQRQATHVEELMRARYTAHTLAEMDFITSSHHPATREEIDIDQTRQWAEKSQWLGIEIKQVTAGGAQDNRGEVEFVVTYRDQQGRRQHHHELSEFEKHDGVWFFKDAKAPKIAQYRRNLPKIGRNDPCSCGSGKKFKKCCGA